MADNGAGRRKKALGEYLGFLADFKTVMGLTTKLGIALPALDYWAEIGPPSPDKAAIVVMVAVIQLSVLLWSFELWHKATFAKARLRFRLKVGLLGALLFLGLYLYLHSLYVVHLPGDGGSEVIGMTYRAEIAELVQTDPRFYTNTELLEQFARTPEKIWTPESIRLALCLLIVAWGLFWLLLSFGASAFITLRWNENKGS